MPNTQRTDVFPTPPQTQNVRGQFAIPEREAGAALTTILKQGTTIVGRHDTSLLEEQPRTVTQPWQILGLYVEIPAQGSFSGGTASTYLLVALKLSVRIKILSNGVPIWIAGQEESSTIRYSATNFEKTFVFSEDFQNPIEVDPQARLTFRLDAEVICTQEAPVYFPWAEGVWKPGQFVTSGGKFFECIKETEASGNKPPEATHWREILTQPEITGATVGAGTTNGIIRFGISSGGR